MNLPRMIRNLWIYRRVLLLALLLGIITSFVLSNSQRIDVSFPFLGTLSQAPAGVVMLMCAALGAGATWMILMLRHTFHLARDQKIRSSEPTHKPEPEESPIVQVTTEKEVAEWRQGRGITALSGSEELTPQKEVVEDHGSEDQLGAGAARK